MKKRLFARYCALLIVIALSGAALLHTSQSVQRAESEVADLKKSIERERQTIDVLEAEWAYLNSPYRLEKLAMEYLQMVPSEAAFIVPDADMLPIEEPVPEGVEILVGDGEVVQVQPKPNAGLMQVSNVPARKPAPPTPVKKEETHSVNGVPETGFQELMSRMGGVQ